MIDNSPSFRPFTMLLALLLCLLAGISNTWAPRQYVNSQRGRYLPDFCKDTYDGNWDPQGPYSRMYGEGWPHLHHYCRGLYKFDTAMLNWRDQRVRRFELTSSLEEFDYVLTKTSNAFVLRPEILVKKGHALLLLDRDIEAIETFTEAMALRRDYAPAYLMLSNYFLRAGDDATALELLELGARNAPDSAALKQRLEEVRAGTATVPEPGAGD